MITIDDFAKLDLRVATVVEATNMDGSDKLLKLKVNDGDGVRQILSGIGKSYNPEELINKQVIIIANLEPRMMMGEESQGMILATGDDLTNITLISPIKEVEDGSRIR